MPRRALGAILTLVLVVWGAGLAWGAAGVVGGSAQPVPSVTDPIVGQQYDVELQLSNTSVSNSSPPGVAFVAVHVATSGSPPSPDEVAHVTLACSTAPCGANELPGTVAFVPVGATGCVSADPNVVSCEQDPLNPNRVLIKTNPLAVTLGPLQLNFALATIRVQQLTRPVTFFMQGDVSYHGTSGTCTGGQCSNIEPNPPATSCTNSVPDCDFSALAGAAVGTANIFPAASCGDSILDPGETCDPPGSVQPGGAVCRNDCTFCGDGIVQGADGEACDDGNNVSGDGCSATCQAELCEIRVDKQVSCDGVTWTDVGLELANEDGTNVVTCPRNQPVFVRYQLQNTGAVNVANCTVGESNLQIEPGGTVITAASLLAGGGVGPTNPLNPSCTDALGQNEPDTATATCECQVSQGGPLTVTATDTAAIVCSPVCGDGQLDPGETCDPPGSVLPGGATCRADCTFCGDGTVQAADGEACDDGNNVSGDGCSATCQTETCSVQVDKQVSCDGVTWTDAGLVTANNDGTNGVTCPRNTPVFVRYQFANTGTANATCGASESNAVIVPGGTIFTGQSLVVGAVVGPTSPVSPQCTDALDAAEPDTVTLSCTCGNGSGGTNTATATDSADIICSPLCGDGQLDPGETCDPPGSVLPGGATCRADCTFCGDGVVQANDGEACDDGNNVSGDGCSASCEVEAVVGCRITGGGHTPNGKIDGNSFANTKDDSWGGQVGAPCGCIGSFDTLNAIRGQWQNVRHAQGGGLNGVFHASDFNSLVCGCDSGETDSNGDLKPPTFNGLCGNRVVGPTPPVAPANLICFSGVADFTPTNGKKTIQVAFRVDAEDRGEPGSGPKCSQSPPLNCDSYRIRVWIPIAGSSETAQGLAQDAACTNGVPPDFCPALPTRDPDIDDGGQGLLGGETLLHGNIQIHRQIAPHVGTCPGQDACPTPLTCEEAG